MVVDQRSNGSAEGDTVPASVSTQAGIYCIQNRHMDGYVRAIVQATILHLWLHRIMPSFTAQTGYPTSPTCPIYCIRRRRLTPATVLGVAVVLLPWKLHWDSWPSRVQLRRFIGDDAWNVLHQGSELVRVQERAWHLGYSTSAPRTPRIDNHAHRYRPSLVPVSATESTPSPADHLLKKTRALPAVFRALPRQMNEPPHAPTYRIRHRVRRKRPACS